MIEYFRLFYLVLSGGLLIWAFTSYLQSRKLPPLPPGPPADPIIGHLRIMPTEHHGVAFHELSKYGKVSHLRALGRTMIILNSVEAAIDLLDKRGAIYSDRITSDVMNLLGWENNMGFFPYGKHLHMHRKMVNDYFNREKCKDYLPLQLSVAHRLVRRANLEVLISLVDVTLIGVRFSVAIILRLDYGIELLSKDDPYLKVVTDANDCNARCAPAGGNLVDMFPIMKYLPSWFPGTFPATQARSWRHIVDRMHDLPFEDVKARIAAGTAKESFLVTHLDILDSKDTDYQFTVDDVKGAAGAICTAGVDTTSSTLMIFMLAMTLYPEVQAEAHAELDRVIGSERLPDFEDRPNLPYLECLVQESYRWHTAVPIGIPHRATEDDIYNGMFIPKGSIVVANTRGMTLDEDIYQEPRRFDPSRYLRGEPHPVGQFGFGRRICPGRHLADANVWIAIASILAAFTISPVKAADGTPIIPEEEFLSGITRQVGLIRCRGEMLTLPLVTLSHLSVS
ncbi:hypothetical protein CVT26_009599 [Gymnopilus dilepis]|uniref:Cytochrome P450 n=1 Tax=Gymnopilus dilepis TaxID=231916 RepID=A0A409YIF5_9AGAR|nr:hypothetical protein CVT26_009599 [Gymnopilus dilepis]